MNNIINLKFHTDEFWNKVHKLNYSTNESYPVLKCFIRHVNLVIAGHRFFKPVGIKKDEIDKPSFLKLSCAIKGLDSIH